MKTNAIQTADIASSLFTRAHAFTAVAGIVIAIICTLVLLRDVTPSQYDSNRSSTTETPAAVMRHQIVKFPDISARSAMSLFK